LATAINSEVPLVLRTITETLTGQGGENNQEQEAEAAFDCLDAWIEWGLGAEYVESDFHPKSQRD
jgi:hypothetical protein